MASDGRVTISRQTGITIGFVILILTAAVSAAWWFGKWTAVDSAWKIETNKRLTAIEESVDKAITDGMANRWTSVDMIRWAHRLQEQNSALKVPQPYIDR